MGLQTNTARNLELDALDESLAAGAKFLSLHTAWPGSTGTSEVAGGSPAYARKAATWNAASAGSKALASGVTFDVPAGTVAFGGMWDAVTVGTFLGIHLLGSSGMKLATTTDTVGETIQSPAHGFVNTDRVVFVQAGSLSLPAGLTEGTVYFVVGAATDTFQVSTTSGGAAVNITAVGVGFVSKMIPEVFAGQGQYTVSAATLDELLT